MYISLHAFSHFPILKHFGEHDNHSWSHIPDHLPEISDSFRSGAYTGGIVVKCNERAYSGHPQYATSIVLEEGVTLIHVNGNLVMQCRHLHVHPVEYPQK